jgi:hypothetical protein
VVNPEDEALAAPKLYIVTVNETLSLGYSFIVAPAGETFEANKMTVDADNVGPVLCHLENVRNRTLLCLSGRRL